MNCKNPLQLAKDWLKWAEENAQMDYPNAMNLATVDPQGHPSNRVVLLKEIDEQGFVFFTNYNSRKGEEIANNPYVAATFYWDKPFRQLKVRGQITKIEREKSEAYWQSRPRASQISQLVSKQSQPVKDRELMDSMYQKAEAEWRDKEIPCPDHWGGYHISPFELEFWIGSSHRFHDRFQFKKDSNHIWLAQRLFP